MQTPAQHADASRCPWCGAVLDGQSLSCPGCGAPAHAKVKTSDSGWIEQPAVKDMARLRVGSSTCQIEGLYVPVADFNLAAGDSVYFAHHVLLWKDISVDIRRMPIGGAFTRMLAGMPLVMTEAHGPGHIAFSRDEPGEMIALPLQPGQAIDVLEHLFLAATRSVAYHFIATDVWFQTRADKSTETHYPIGRYMDRFTAGDEPGLLLLHAGGNVFVRELAEGQTILLKPRSLLYKDPSVNMALSFETPSGAMFTAHRVMWLHLTGPGRVAIQSAYERAEDPGRDLCGHSWAPPGSTTVRQRWQINVALSGSSSQNASGLAQAVAAAMRNQPAPTHVDPRHALMVEMIRKVLQGRTVPPEMLPKLIEAAKQHGLSEYDVKLIIRHFESHGN